MADDLELLRDLPNLPKTWEGYMKYDDLPQFYVLHPTSTEYREIEAQLSRGTRNKYKIHEIKRIQIPWLYYSVLSYAEDINKKNDNKSPMEWLWYGANPELIDYINHNGFNRSHKREFECKHGEGLYFHRLSGHACSDVFSKPDPNGYKYVYLSIVAPGDYTTGDRTMIDTPPKNEGVLHIKYDSLVNDRAKPSTYVIFSDTQAYPEYLIKFRLPY